MSVAALVAAVLLGWTAPAATQQTQDEPTTLPEVEVTRQRTAEAVRSFVGQVAAPAMGRGLAYWHVEICPGVANLDPLAAQQIVDRITAVAADLDLRTGEPGCNPNLVILFTNDGTGLAQGLVERDRKIFRQNAPGLDRGTAAFRDFQTSDRPVRWWSLSAAFDEETGIRAFRLPGDQVGMHVDSRIAQLLGCEVDDCPIGAAPILNRTTSSRVRSYTVDNLYKTIIIVDLDRIGAVDTGRLGDYLAFIGLAQVDVQADTTGYDTVLNLFSGGGETGLTDWDRAYLHALYSPRPLSITARAQAGDIAGFMTRDVLTSRRAE